MVLTEKQIKRFWSFVNIENQDCCWNWKGYILNRGYGQISLNGKGYSAHRIAYMLTYGEIANDLFVCHSCDNRKCCNPNHLWLGTTQDNTRDREEKGRHQDSRGEYNGQAKLKQIDILEIRKLHASTYDLARNDPNKYSISRLAEMFNMSLAAISLIINRKTWTHI